MQVRLNFKTLVAAYTILLVFDTIFKCDLATDDTIIKHLGITCFFMRDSRIWTPVRWIDKNKKP